MILDKYIKNLYLVFDEECEEEEYSPTCYENIEICKNFELWVKQLNETLPELIVGITIRAKLMEEFSSIIVFEYEKMNKQKFIDISWEIYNDIKNIYKEEIKL